MTTDPDAAPVPTSAASRWRARWRAQPMWGDGFVMVLLMPLTLAAQTGSEKHLLGLLAAFAWALLFTLPLLWRRTAPDLVACLVVVACVVQLAVESSFVAGDFAVPVVLYAVSRYGRPRWQRAWLVVALLGSVAAGIDWGWPENLVVHTWPARIVRMVGFAIACSAVALASWLLGQWLRQRDLTMHSLRERAVALEAERDKAVQLAAEEERSRIAREMHDIVAHSLSVIVVQSDGAGYLAEHPEIGDAEARLQQVARAVATINATAREALGETRRLVGVLRHGGDAVELAPSATLDQLPELVQRLTEAGVSASFTTVGDPACHVPLASGAEMALYRVAQEALTNVMKHAGPGASAQVTLAHTPGAVELRVSNTGRVGGASDGAGHGLIGMRERMASRGGTLVAGPVPGGFEVRADVPAEPMSPTTAAGVSA